MVMLLKSEVNPDSGFDSGLEDGKCFLHSSCCWRPPAWPLPPAGGGGANLPVAEPEDKGGLRLGFTKPSQNKVYGIQRLQCLTIIKPVEHGFHRLAARTQWG